MKANGMQKKKMTGNGFLLLITIALFAVMYIAGMIIFADKGFAKPQMFLNLFVSNAGLLVIACGLTIVMITGGIDISVGSVMSLYAGVCCMILAGYGNVNVQEYAHTLLVGIGAGLLVTLICGVFNGFLVAYMNIQPMVATLILWSAGRAVGLLLCNSQIVYVRVPSFQKLGAYCGIIPTPIIVAAVCVAAHECGHAIQYAEEYTPMKVRGALVKVTNFSSSISMFIVILGLIFSFRELALVGVALFSVVVLFQLVTLPVEFNASRRAVKILDGYMDREELSGVKSVLSAAAMTYVAALVSAIFQLIRLLAIVGGGRDRK